MSTTDNHQGLESGASRPISNTDGCQPPPASQGVDRHTAIKKIEYADSHFHLFRTAEQLKVQGEVSLSKILRHDQNEHELSLAIASVCDPKFLQGLTDNYVSLTSDARLRFAVGIHPKRIPVATTKSGAIRPYTLRQIRDLLIKPSVVAVGEIGLDFVTESRDVRATQLRFLKAFLDAVGDIVTQQRLPIVLHLRPGLLDTYRELSEHAVRIISETVGREHPIQLHCFTGTAADTQFWLDSCPNVMFSLATGMVRVPCSPEQQQMIAAIPMQRLLLETDSPHLGLRSRQLSTPCDLPRTVDRLVALTDCADARALLDLTLANARRFFG